MLKVLAHFSVLDDPRAANARHELAEIMFAKEALLRTVLELPHGIPSHDTFSTVFRTLDPTAFGGIFSSFAAAFGTAIAKDDVIAVDGKSMKRAYEKGRRSSPRMIGDGVGRRGAHDACRAAGCRR